jgi:hypothetical protein
VCDLDKLISPLGPHTTSKRERERGRLTLGREFERFGAREAHHDAAVGHGFEDDADERGPGSAHGRDGVKVLRAEGRTSKPGQPSRHLLETGTTAPGCAPFRP